MAPMRDAQKRFGYADLLALPEDGRRYEIHGGELVVVAAPLVRHQIVVLEVATMLADYGRRSGGLAVTAPCDIVFDEHDVVQPDVVYFRAERTHRVSLDAVTRVAPDVAVEVLSPSTASIDRGRKMRMFARYGVPEYWIVDPVGLDDRDPRPGGRRLSPRADRNRRRHRALRAAPRPVLPRRPPLPVRIGPPRRQVWAAALRGLL